LLASVDLHFDAECLHQHIHCIVVFGRKWNNDIGMLHRWLDKIIVGRLNELAVLCKNVDYGAATL
jgi:hypothetical protein